MNFPQINSKINLDSLGLERDDLIWSSVPTFWIDEIYKDTSGAIFTASKQMYDSGYLYKRTYDDILLLELQKDPNNIIANYELIKLRFQGGYIGLAKFQLDRMVRIYPENKEFIRIQKEIEDEFGNELYDETLTWDEMMEMLVLYDE
ncbi:MAG: hypothetical protein OEW75_11415 [Cyclobacteriaceae bacterium]|nr:hypothetical protein [Cyclobacteriaceae bacterium]